jgi:serine/threonine-protein kinase
MLDTGTVVGGYRIEGLLGRGGMGTVFRARDLHSGRVIALKLMADAVAPDPLRDARFRGEARTQASLDHPHVVTVYDAGESDLGLYLAMRLVDGPVLVDLVRNRELDTRRSLDLLGQVADALDAAHAVGLVHRDIKPHNVLVGEHDHAYLADFGLTRGGLEPALTATGEIVGTVAYLAPEVVRGGEAGPASDRYAFAAMAFECLAGSVVFPRTSGAAVLFAHANDPPPRIGARRPELGDVLDDLFERALAKDPAERPATARELVDGIRRRLERTGAIELPPPPPPGAAALGLDHAGTDSAVPLAPSPQSRAGRRPVVLAALAGAAIVAALWLAFGQDGTDTPRAVSLDQPGLEYIGATLGGAPGRPLDCLGRAPRPSSPACTVVQSSLPGATVVVPRSGVIRHWQVRAARGELTLVVTRPRGGGAFQVATSSTESAGSADVQGFDADIAVERGDLVGLHVSPGGAVGVRDRAAGATTERWLPPLKGLDRAPDRPGGTGFDHELLLRVGVLPGGAPRPPHQITGSAAERLPAGLLRERRTVRFGRRPTRLALVRIGDAFALDEFAGHRRVARIEVPGLRGGAQITLFLAARWGPGLGGLDVSYVNADSARVIQHTYAVAASGFTLVR